MILQFTEKTPGHYITTFEARTPFALKVKWPDDDRVRNMRLFVSADKDSEYAHIKSYNILPRSWEKEIELSVFPRFILLESFVQPESAEVFFNKTSETLPGGQQQQIAQLTTDTNALKQIIPIDDLDGNGIPDGEDRLIRLKDSIPKTLTEEELDAIKALIK